MYIQSSLAYLKPLCLTLGTNSWVAAVTATLKDNPRRGQEQDLIITFGLAVYLGNHQNVVVYASLSAWKASIP
jgi:hypothetical protein